MYRWTMFRENGLTHKMCTQTGNSRRPDGWNPINRCRAVFYTIRPRCDAGQQQPACIITLSCEKMFTRLEGCTQWETCRLYLSNTDCSWFFLVRPAIVTVKPWPKKLSSHPLVRDLTEYETLARFFSVSLSLSLWLYFFLSKKAKGLWSRGRKE